MRIEYRPNYFDFLLFNCVHQLFSGILQLFYIAMASLIPLTMPDGTPKSQIVVSGLIIYVLLWLLQFVFNAVYLYSKKHRCYITEHVMEVDHKGLSDQTKYGQTMHYWIGDVKIVARPGFVAVYISAFAAYVIPNRAFASDGPRVAFISLIKEEISGVQER